MTPGLDRLNRAGLGASQFGTRKTTGMSAQVAKNLANSSPATKSSYFSFAGAKRTNFVPARNVSENMYKYDYTRARASLNGTGRAHRTYTPSYSGSIGHMGMQNVQINNDYAKGQVIGQTIAVGIGLLNQLGVFNGVGSSGSSSLGDKLGTALDNLGGTATATTFSGQLAGTTTFNNLNKLEATVNTKTANLNSDYQKLDPRQEMNNIKKEASDGFQLAGVTLNTDSLQLTSLDKGDLAKCITDIEGDIDKFGNFQTNELPAAKNQITTESGKTKGAISAKEGELSRLEASNKDGVNDAKIAQLKQEIEKLKQDLEKLQKAETAIQELNTKCENTKADLEAKKAEVKDIKKFNDKVKDKKYDLAKSQDKDLKQALDKLKKLDAEIAKASVDKNGAEYNKKDERRENKLSKLTAERNTVFNSMSKLISSLSAAGPGPFVNSKNQSYTITNLQAALDYKPAVAQS